MSVSSFEEQTNLTSRSFQGSRSKKADREDSKAVPLKPCPCPGRQQGRPGNWLRVEMAILLAALIAVVVNADRLADEFRTMTGLEPD